MFARVVRNAALFVASVPVAIALGEVVQPILSEILRPALGQSHLLVQSLEAVDKWLIAFIFIALLIDLIARAVVESRVGGVPR